MGWTGTTTTTTTMTWARRFGGRMWVGYGVLRGFGYHDLCLAFQDTRHSGILAMMAMGQFPVYSLCAVCVLTLSVWRRVLWEWAGKPWVDPGGVWWVLWHGMTWTERGQRRLSSRVPVWVCIQIYILRQSMRHVWVGMAARRGGG